MSKRKNPQKQAWHHRFSEEIQYGRQVLWVSLWTAFSIRFCLQMTNVAVQLRVCHKRWNCLTKLLGSFFNDIEVPCQIEKTNISLTALLNLMIPILAHQIMAKSVVEALPKWRSWWLFPRRSMVLQNT